jgi:PAS domain S-box-containing protein
MTPPLAALLVPFSGPGTETPTGFLVAGLNPHRRNDADYPSFVRLIAGQIGAGLANAEGYEAERRRAVELSQAVRLREQAANVLQAANATLTAEVQQRTVERDFLRSLFQQAPGFICVLRGPDHVFELVNEAYLQLVGHRDLIGKPVLKALPEIEGQGFLELLDEVYRSGEAFVGHGLRAQLQREPGAPLQDRFLHLVYQPIFDADGHVTGIFAEGSDVTEQVRAQDELKALNETLEARVSERTSQLEDALETLRRESSERELVEEALRQAQKMEAVGQLTGGIAHDFNNLLTGIVGSLDLMQSRMAQGRTADLDRYAKAAMASANRAAALTHRLLAFARRQPLDPKPVEANRLVSSMEELLRRTIGESIQMEIVTAGGLWSSLCDPHQLESAILNLAINARDAMPDGGKLTIETCNTHLDRAYASQHPGVNPGQYICICVTDTGTGMAPEVIARAFDPFFTTKPTGQGTGLGLSMIYGFARQSEGHAKIYSEVGKGTRSRSISRATAERRPRRAPP